MEENISFEKLKVSTQTIVVILDVKNLNIELARKTVGMTKKIISKDKKNFNNAACFYTDIGEKNIYSQLFSTKVNFTGCKDVSMAIKATKIIISHLEKCRRRWFPDLYDGLINVIDIKESMTNLRSEIGENLHLKRIYNHFKDYPVFYATYIPSQSSNLSLKYPILYYDGKKKDFTITITRKGKLVFCGRDYRGMRDIYNIFNSIFNEILPYAIS